MLILLRRRIEGGWEEEIRREERGKNERGKKLKEKGRLTTLRTDEGEGGKKWHGKLVEYRRQEL